MVTIGGIPAHPLIIHAVVVLLPLAALGAIVIAVRPRLRRPLGVPLALVTLVGVVAVPLATASGDQLRAALRGGGPLVAVHESRAGYLLPWAIVFGVLVFATVILDRVAARPDPDVSVPDTASAGGTTTTTVAGVDTATLRRVTTVVAALTALAGIAVTVLVVWIGDAGAQAVWGGVGRG